jgi:tight adherence protein B
MSSLLFALAAATGTYLLWTRASSPRTDRKPDPRRRPGARLQSVLHQAGLGDVSPVQFLVTSAALGLVAALFTAAVVGPGPSALLIGGAAALAPATMWRHRRSEARRAARDSWPNMIEELRVLTGSVGRPIPQALIEVGLRGPFELRPAFLAAQREWLLTTDFERTISVLTNRLADPTADVVCETLLVASQVGGDLDGRLIALAEDRRQDLAGRREATAKQSGARFARWFVILVPAGMAFAGLQVGDGAQAYRTPTGQALVTAGVALVVVCWWWASRIMRLPEDERVLR